MTPNILTAVGNGQDLDFALISDLVLSGKLVAFPTDTFYALGADPYRPEAVRSLFRLKGRPEDKPVILLIGDFSWAQRLWGEVDRRALILMERFWPGPLTLIAPAGPDAPQLPGSGGLALRMPGNRLTLEVLAHLKTPLTGTSANPAGSPPAGSAAEVAAYFPEGLDLILDGGTFEGGCGSTVVELDPHGWKLVREGMIPMGLVAKTLENIG